MSPVQSVSFITVLKAVEERKEIGGGGGGGECIALHIRGTETLSISGHSGQHVPKAAAAQCSPTCRQAGTFTCVVPSPLFHNVDCILRSICIDWSWRRRCILPSVRWIALVAWFGWCIWPCRPYWVARIRARTRWSDWLLGIWWIWGSWARARIRRRMFVVHVGCQAFPSCVPN